MECVAKYLDHTGHVFQADALRHDYERLRKVFRSKPGDPDSLVLSDEESRHLAAMDDDDRKLAVEFLYRSEEGLQRDLQAAVGRLVELLQEVKRTLKDAASGAAGDGGKPPEVAPSGPVVLLASWPEILAVLCKKKDDRRRVSRLNKTYDGPIKIGRKGCQPLVDRTALLKWYEELETRFQDRQSRERDKWATVADQYSYGKAGNVVPEISGGVKKRRQRSKT